MKRPILFLSAIMLLTGTVLFAGVSMLTARSINGDDKDLMERKTRRAESILRGLALGDLEMVGAQAAALEKLTIEADYEHRGDRFADYGRSFLHTVRSLKKEAINGNLAGTYYQFTRMTGLCFSCHEHLRDSAEPSGNQ